MNLTRRDVLVLSAGTSAELAQALQHAHDASRRGANFEAFDANAAADIEALAACILPSDDGPGAREAGVIYFIDRALSTFDADKRELYRTGIEEVHQHRKRLFPRSRNIAALTAGERLQLAHAIEKLPFFELLRTHTVLGFLGNPSYGGNRGGVGWQYIGFNDRMQFQPPFGYYDARKDEE